MAVAHYLEALDWQRAVIKVHALLGAKNPHPQTWLVGGMSIPVDPNSQNAVNAHTIAVMKDLSKKALQFVEKVYIPDLLAVASFYKEWAGIGGGVGHYLSYGEFQNDNVSHTANCWLPAGFIRNKDIGKVEPVDHSNENTIREIEALGGEAMMPPIGEWLLYVTHNSRENAWRTRQFRILIHLWLKNYVQMKDEHTLSHIFHGSLRHLEEPTIPETLDMAKLYLHPSFKGEAILSMGKAEDFYRKGAAGIVNIMPFTCMPGTVVNALFNRFREEHLNLPFLNLSFDGQEQTHTRTRLEAFMYQVRQFHDRRR